MGAADDPDLADLPVCEFAFPGPLRDALVAAVLTGEKTATTGLVVDYEACGEPVPSVGDREVVVDSDGVAVAVIELTDVVCCAVGEVDLATAIAEGEGFTSVAAWREAHDDFWTSQEFRDAIGQPDFIVTDDALAVVQWFRVVQRL